MLNRALRAAFLDGSLYKQIGDEPEEMFYALGIVLLSGIVLGLGLGLGLDHLSLGSGGQCAQLRDVSLMWMVFLSAYTRLAGWFLLAGIVYIVGTKFLGGSAGFRQILRSLGMTFAPGLLALFAGIPVVGMALLGISMIWLFPAGWIAIRETQQFDWVRSLICVTLGWFAGVGGAYYILLIIIVDPSVELPC